MEFTLIQHFPPNHSFGRLVHIFISRNTEDVISIISFLIYLSLITTRCIFISRMPDSLPYPLLFEALPRTTGDILIYFTRFVLECHYQWPSNIVPSIFLAYIMGTQEMQSNEFLTSRLVTKYYFSHTRHGPLNKLVTNPLQNSPDSFSSVRLPGHKGYKLLQSSSVT